MKSGDVKIIDRVTAIDAIKRLNEEDLRFLNRMIVERLQRVRLGRATSIPITDRNSNNIVFTFGMSH